MGLSGRFDKALRVAAALAGAAGVGLWAYSAHGDAPSGLSVAAPMAIVHAGVALGLNAALAPGRMRTALRAAFLAGPGLFTFGVLMGAGAPFGGLLTIAAWLGLGAAIALETRGPAV